MKTENAEGQDVPSIIWLEKCDLLEFLMEHTELKGFEFLPENDKQIKHGSCCVCGDCGHWHDECVCYHNEILEHLNRISNNNVQRRETETGDRL